MVDDNNKLIEELRVQETLAVRRLRIVEYQREQIETIAQEAIRVTTATATATTAPAATTATPTTPSSETLSTTVGTRRTKLPDPPVFDGKEPRFDNWLGKMKSKLAVNGNHYPTNMDQIAYI